MKTMTEKTTPKGSTYMQWIFAILANMILLSYGLQCGWISAMTRTLQSERSPTGAPLTDDEISWLASAPSLAAVLGVSFYAYTVDRRGRKICIISMGVLHAIGIIIKLCPASTSSLVVAQVCIGLAAGGGFNVVPMYVREISQDDIRGTLGMLLIMCQNVGILAMYAMGGYLGYYTVLWVVLPLPAISAVLMIKAPESPAYLVKVGEVDNAASIIASLRGLGSDDKRIQSEIDSLKSEDEKFRSIPNISFVGIFNQRAWRKGFIYMIIIMVIHGMNGGFTIVNYASTMLLRSGVTWSPELQSLSVPVFMIIGSLISMICIERVGRRILFAASFIVSTLSFCGIAAILRLQDSGSSAQAQAQAPGWLLIACTVTAVCAYAGGVSPLPFVVMSEMFTFQIRAKVMGCLVTLGWLFSFVQLLAYGPVTRTFGAHVSFLCFAAINTAGAVMVLVFLPETRGKTVGQIEMDLEKRPDSRMSLEKAG